MNTSSAARRPAAKKSTPVRGAPRLTQAKTTPPTPGATRTTACSQRTGVLGCGPALQGRRRACAARVLTGCDGAQGSVLGAVRAEDSRRRQFSPALHLDQRLSPFAQTERKLQRLRSLWRWRGPVLCASPRNWPSTRLQGRPPTPPTFSRFPARCDEHSKNFTEGSTDRGRPTRRTP